ncbi:MAG: shikimate dehydrogenase [Halofilum sp. (in: g-proteobacteria)]
MASDRYAVIGHPVSHSLSPTIHARFAQETGEDLEYGLLEPAEDGFAEAASAFFADGGLGLNVTVPFKAEARTWCDRVSDRAKRASVVNTLTLQANGWVAGDNTDGTGLVRDLTVNLDLGLAGARILLVGAGGAARGVLAPLLGETPAEIVIANRTATRAEELAGDFADDGPVRGCGFEALRQEPAFDIIVNASAASLGGALPPLPPTAVARGGTVYDMMYGPKAEPFLAWGRDAGAATVSDGLGMLVEQAAESFLIWRGIRPETAGILAALRAEAGD